MAELRDQPIVVVLADDLIWGTRLSRMAAAAGGQVRDARDLASFRTSLEGAALAIVDTTARGYEPIEAVRWATAARVPCACLVQHDDAQQRDAAIVVGARHVVPYRTMSERGARLIGEWLRDEEKVR